MSETVGVEGVQRPPLARPTEGRVLAGVCAGVSRHLGVPLTSLRLITAVSILFLFGVPVYAFLWLTMPQSDGPALVTPFDKDGSGISRGRLFLIGIPVLVVGGLAGSGAIRSVARLSLTLPLLVIGVGLVLVWSRLGTAERRQWLSAHDRRETRIRTVIGVVMALMGIILLLSQGGGIERLRDVTVGGLVVLLGAGILGAPFIARFFDTLRKEQTERIRATEKADIAAHLHDSVLQTLALIQRRADDPSAVQLLARAQERELRSWLYAEQASSGRTLATAVTDAAGEIETLHGIPIDVVATGDRPLGEGEEALLRALREALANAVRHGEPPVSVYLEVGPAAAEAFVRDHGPGFDPDTVSEDRLGVRESIIGRMTRHGGEAQVRRLDDGTEVRLRMPLESATSGAESGAADDRDTKSDREQR
ncbi:MAG TPA: PspC domain-containing protein [Flexivirga sp.]|uniref:ATP-binding protein n=1 Tax=Flexivirga sp. TaxID=1962927 RepID=UPI002CE85950|nr:PspC domain-containing protein [Flexivirga sp.]HWC22930.1 PspC domain-containing protein [Flexivirga sp.]